jgi:hypothetical protein
MHVLINVKTPGNISKWQVGFNSAFKGFISILGGVDVAPQELPPKGDEAQSW